MHRDRKWERHSGLWEEEWELLLIRDRVSNWDDEKALEMGDDDGCGTLSELHVAELRT